LLIIVVRIYLPIIHSAGICNSSIFTAGRQLQISFHLFNSAAKSIPVLTTYFVFYLCFYFSKENFAGLPLDAKPSTPISSSSKTVVYLLLLLSYKLL
jgi:hypothetical protein